MTPAAACGLHTDKGEDFCKEKAYRHSNDGLSSYLCVWQQKDDGSFGCHRDPATKRKRCECEQDSAPQDEDAPVPTVDVLTLVAQNLRFSVSVLVFEAFALAFPFRNPRFERAS